MPKHFRIPFTLYIAILIARLVGIHIAQGVSRNAQ